MTSQARGWMVSLSALGLLFLFAIAVWRLPGFGRYPGPYGNIANAITVAERKITNVPTAVMFDIRGFDTLFEEYILFTAVTGLSMLLRAKREKPGEAPLSGRQGKRSEAIAFFGRGLGGLNVLVSVYIVVHGNVTPGGGFHGGVVFSTAFMLIYLCGSYGLFRRSTPKTLFEVIESAGAAGYAIVGLATLAATGVFLENALYMGSKGGLWSGGTIWIINYCAGIEVAAAFVLVVSEFLKETRLPQEAATE